MAETVAVEPWQEVLRLSYYVWIGVVEAIKVLYLTTCDCRGSGQPFNGWFFQAFHQSPYSLYWNYKGIRFLGGPYSLFWWFLNLPGYLGYFPFFAYILTFEILAFALFYRRNRWYALYFLTLGVWFTTIDPVDFFVVLFAVAGRYRAVWLVLSPLTKLPFGSELWTAGFSVWAWTFTDPNSLHGVENYGRYLIIGSIWLFSLVLYLHRKKHLLHVQSQRL